MLTSYSDVRFSGVSLGELIEYSLVQQNQPMYEIGSAGFPETWIDVLTHVEIKIRFTEEEYTILLVLTRLLNKLDFTIQTAETLDNFLIIEQTWERINYNEYILHLKCYQPNEK